jgi:hypothetical protein
MRRAPKYAALATLALIWAVSAAGCISIPVPPTTIGETKAGSLGSLDVKLVLAYRPNWQNLVAAAFKSPTDGFKK